MKHLVDVMYMAISMNWAKLSRPRFCLSNLKNSSSMVTVGSWKQAFTIACVCGGGRVREKVRCMVNKRTGNVNIKRMGACC